MPIPPLKGDALRRSTVLPYLEAHHYEAERDLANVYFTEHDINGELGAGREWCECCQYTNRFCVRSLNILIENVW